MLMIESGTNLWRRIETVKQSAEANFPKSKTEACTSIALSPSILPTQKDDLTVPLPDRFQNRCRFISPTTCDRA